MENKEFLEEWDKWAEDVKKLSMKEINTIFKNQQKCLHDDLIKRSETAILDDKDETKVIGKIEWFICKKCYALISNKRSIKSQQNQCYLVKIELKDDPDTIILKEMSAERYPHFLEEYPDIAISKGLKIKKISVKKKFKSEEEILLW